VATVKPIQLQLSPTIADRQHLAQWLADTVQALPVASLPLQACCTQGGWVKDGSLEVSVLDLKVDSQHVRARLGIFFGERLGGCNCHDDPVEIHAYCLCTLELDRASGLAELRAEPE
jgi:hypothetical protein